MHVLIAEFQPKTSTVLIDAASPCPTVPFPFLIQCDPTRSATAWLAGRDIVALGLESLRRFLA